MADMETQITNTDDYNYRVDEDPITIGCYNGGTLTYTPAKGGTRLMPSGTRLTLRACAFTRGAPMTGTGFINDDAGTFRLAVRLGGRNRLVSFDDADGVKSVPGRYRGEAVNQRR